MARIITVANQKGGVGKTTTAINLAASLGAAERRTLLVDIDPQANATSGSGVELATIQEKQIYHVLIGEKPVEECIVSTPAPFVDLLPATGDLIGFEMEGIDLPDREHLLKAALNKVRDRYETILIDCPPSLGLLTINALTAADGVLVPLQCEYFALEGLGRLMGTLDLIRKNLNPTLQLEGIVLTMFDKRNRLAHQVADEVQSHFPKDVFAARIPRNVRLSEAPSFGKPILLYDIRSPGAQAYLALADEYLGRMNAVRGASHERTESIGTGTTVPDSHVSNPGQ